MIQAHEENREPEQAASETDREKLNSVVSSKPETPGAVGSQVQAAEQRPTPKKSPTKRWDWRNPLGFKITDCIMAACTFILMVCAIIYTIYSGRQWKVMRDQIPELRKSADAAKDAAANAQKELELAQRPWMAADLSVREPIEFKADGIMWVKIRITMKNVGHSVATNVRNAAHSVVWAGHGIGLEPTLYPAKHEKQLCDEWRDSNSGEVVRNPIRIFPWQLRFSPPLVLFPEQASTLDLDFAFQKREIDDAVVSGYIQSVIIFGCIDYTSSLGSQHHETGYVMEISKPKRPHSESRLKVGETVPPSQLEVGQYMYGGAYVD